MAPDPEILFLRSPEGPFENLPDFPYEPHYLEYGNLRMAYVDELNSTARSSPDQETFLCLHGQPTWSYLYRKMIPIFLNYSTLPNPPPRRVIAPDLIGFGRSDKPTRDADYTFTLHRNSLLHLIQTLDLKNITLVVQDWGGILGLTLPLSLPGRIKRLLVMNTTLATGTSPTSGFLAWRAFSNRSPDMKIGQLMRRSCSHLSPAEAAAYDAPFPNLNYKAGVRAFPNLVMVDADMEGVDVSRRSVEMYGSSDVFRAEDLFMVCGQRDPVLGPPVMQSLARVWKNGCFYAEVAEAGHFVQEWGGEVARMAVEVFEREGRVDGVRRMVPEKGRL